MRDGNRIMTQESLDSRGGLACAASLTTSPPWQDSALMSSSGFQFSDSKVTSLTDQAVKPLHVMFTLTSMPIGGAETLLANLMRRMTPARFRPAAARPGRRSR